MSKIQVTIDGSVFEVDVQLGAPGQATATIDGQALPIVFARQGSGDPVEWMLVEGRSYEVVADPQLRWVRTARGQHRVELHDLATPGARLASGDGRVKAPIPGTVARVLVQPGQAVSAGQPLLVLEAMKMENEIRAPRSGQVERVNVAVGQGVPLGMLLAEVG